MIRKTETIQHRLVTVKLGDSRPHRFHIITWWLLFIPIYRSEKILEFR